MKELSTIRRRVHSVLAAVAASLAICSAVRGDDPPFTGRVLVGPFFFLTNGYAQGIGSLAGQQAANANYRTLQTNGNDPDIAKAEIQKPELHALVIVAHGAEDAQTPGAYVPGAKFNGTTNAPDGFFTPDDLPPGAIFPQYQVVILHCCGQNLPAWRNRFPNAVFEAWRRDTTLTAIKSWQKKFTFPNYQAPGLAPSQLHPMPDVHPNLWSRNRPIIGNRRLAPIASPQDPWFQMSPSLTAGYGSKTFNLIQVEDDDSSPLTLLGLRVEGGHVVEFNGDGFSLPNYVVTARYGAMFSAFENPGSFADSFNRQDGSVRLTVLNSGGASDAILFEGAAAVLFGIGAGVLPSAEEVPTLSPVGAILLGVLLLTAFFVLRRRSVAARKLWRMT